MQMREEAHQAVAVDDLAYRYHRDHPVRMNIFIDTHVYMNIDI